MERKNKKRLLQSLEQSLLDRPIPKLAYNKALPPPLVPTKYVAPTPKPKPRRHQPIALPRNITKSRDPSLQSFINEISPYFEDEAKRKFAKKK